MRIWADVLDAAGNKLGEGPITSVISARVTRKLDGAGSVSITVPGTDSRAVDLLQNERRLIVYGNLGGSKREIGRGIVKSRSIQENESGWRLQAEGPDTLHELKLKNTLLAREYDLDTIEDVIDDLAGLASWTADVDSGLGTMYARFDGASVLKALQSIAGQNGLHFRFKSGTELEFGALGVDSGLRIIHKNQAPAELYTNDDVALIERLRVSYESEAVANWLLPIGAGEGEAALTLERSTRTSPHTIQSMTGPDGRTLYYLKDTASITTYGQIEKVGTFKDISPLSNSDTDIENAANALYDAAVAWLERHKDQQVAYSVTVKKAWATTIKPGDKIHVSYHGFVYRDGEKADYVDIDGDYWVMAATENIGHTQAVSLTLASVDRHELDNAQVVIGRLEAIELRNLKVQTHPSQATYTYVRQMDDSHDADIPVLITDAVTYLHRCQVRLVTRPFRTLAQSAAEYDLTHAHLIGLQSSAPAGTQDVWINTNWKTSLSDAGISIKTKLTIDSAGSISGRNPYVNWLPLPHEHDIDYGINDDTEYPDTLRIKINGVDRTTALGGPWGSGGSAVDVTLDITEYLNEASGGLRQEHTVKLFCDDGQGEVEAVVELFQTVQSIAVT